MDERTLEVVIKAQNETKAAFAEIMASLAALQAQTDMARGNSGGNGLLGFISSLAMLMPGGTVMGYAILGVLALSTVLAPLAVALVAVVANFVAWAAIATVALSAIGGLTAAIFLLGAANAGGLSPATEMVKTHHAVATAIKNHAKALEELAQAKAGVDVYELGKGHRAQNVAWAQSYVTATSQNLADAQHDMGEPVSGMGGPIAGLGSAIDDMVHHFEKASRPLAEHIATWATQFLPAIEKAGDAIMKWFGERMPAIFKFLTPVIQDLGGFFGDLFSTIGKTIDYVLAHGPEFEGFWKGFLKFASGAFDGLMNFMMNIADWFRVHWPGISKTAGEVADAIKAAWNNPLVQEGIKEIKKLLGDVIAHLGDLKPLLPIVGGAIVAMALVVEGGIGGLLLLLRTLEAIVAAMQWIADHWNLTTAQGGQFPGGGGRYGAGSNGHAPTPLGSPNVRGIIGL